MEDNNGDALVQYFKVRRVLNMISGVCFLIYICVFPALYFKLSSNNDGTDYSYVLYAPLTFCLVVQLVCGGMLYHYRRKALGLIHQSAVDYTQAIARAPPGTAIPYQHPRTGQQTVYIMPAGSFPQFNNANTTPYSSNANLHQYQQQQMMAQPPPTYNQVVTDQQMQKSESAPQTAGWALPPPFAESSSASHASQDSTSLTTS